MSTERGTPYAVPGGPRRRRGEAGDGIRVIGITGGLSAGKSTLVARFEESGARVVSADRIGHELLDDPEVRGELEAAFGEGIRAADGGLDRARLGRLAFASPQALQKLNAISHPRLLQRLRAQLEELRAGPYSGLVVLEAALLVEWDLGPWCDLVIAVVAPEEERVRRAVRQRGLTAEEARRRLERQLPDAVRVRYADLAVENDGSLAELEARAGELVERLWADWRASRK